MANLEIINLSSGYNSLLFHNLSFKKEFPGLLAILGKNGSGKTTLIKCIAQQQKFEGEIMWNSRSIKDLPVSKRAGILSYLNQKNSISLNVKVRDIVVMGRYRFKSLFNNYNSEDYDLVDYWLEKLGVYQYRDNSIQELSGGEQQLVWIAQAFIQDTPIIILDEPSSQLDLMNKRKVFDLISEQSTEEKIVVLVSHDIEYLKNLDGHLINLSLDKPELQKISEEEINFQRSVLESD